MLTHQIPCINILNSTQFKPFILAIFHANNTWTFWSNSIQTGTIFNSPKTEQWAVRGQPIHQTLVPLCETENHGHFLPHTHQNIIYYINYHTATQNSPYTVQNEFKIFQQFGPKFWDRSNGHSRPQINPSINKTFKQGVNQVGENPYLPEFVETPQKWYPRVALTVGSNFASCLAEN